MNVKKLMTGTLALIMCFGMAACGNTDDDDDESVAPKKTLAEPEAEDESESKDKDDKDPIIDPFADSKDESSEEAPHAVEIAEPTEGRVQLDGLAEKLPDIQLANTTVKWFAHYDINPAAGSAVPVSMQLFKDKYNGELQYIHVGWDVRYNTLAKKIMSQDSPDLFPANDMDGFPYGAIRGMFQPADDYIDFGSELWQDMASVNDGFKFNGKHYLTATGMDPYYVCIYNTKTIVDNGLDDPAELYYNGEWTWSAFTEMCRAFTDPDTDRYGVDGYWYASALNDTCGAPLIGMTNGKLVNNMGDPAVCKVQELMYDFQKKGLCFDRYNNNWSARGSGETGEGIGSYLTLFYPVGLWAIENPPYYTQIFGDVSSDEIMFVPMPRMDDSDTHYVTASFNGYHIVTGATNPEGAAAYINCVMAAKDEDEKQDEETFANEYMWNDNMLEMRREIYRLLDEHAVVDLRNAVSNDLSAVMSSVSQATMTTGGLAVTWDACRDDYEKSVDSLLAEANKSL